MDGGHSIGAMRSDNGEVCHANLSRRRLFYQTDALNSLAVSWETNSYFVEQAAVNLVNNLKLPRKHRLEPCDGPLLECLRKQCVIRIRQCLSCQIPGHVPSQVRIIQKNAHQFGYCHRRVGVVQLDSCLIRQFLPITVVAQKPTNHVSDRTGDKEILLQETEALSRSCVIIRVEHARQRFRL